MCTNVFILLESNSYATFYVSSPSMLQDLGPLVPLVSHPFYLVLHLAQNLTVLRPCQVGATLRPLGPSRKPVKCSCGVVVRDR